MQQHIIIYPQIHINPLYFVSLVWMWDLEILIVRRSIKLFELACLPWMLLSHIQLSFNTTIPWSPTLAWIIQSLVHILLYPLLKCITTDVCIQHQYGTITLEYDFTTPVILSIAPQDLIMTARYVKCNVIHRVFLWGEFIPTLHLQLVRQFLLLEYVHRLSPGRQIKIRK